MLYDRQRNVRKRFQDPLCRGLVGHLCLVFRVQAGKFGLIFLKRPSKHKLHDRQQDRKSTRLNSSHLVISYAVFCLKKKKNNISRNLTDESQVKEYGLWE